MLHLTANSLGLMSLLFGLSSFVSAIATLVWACRRHPRNSKWSKSDAVQLTDVL